MDSFAHLTFPLASLPCFTATSPFACWLFRVGAAGWDGAGAVRLAIRLRRQAGEGPGRLPDLHGRLGEGDGRAAPPHEDLPPEAQVVDVHHVWARE